MCNTKQRIILLVVTFISFKLFGQTSTKKIYYPSRNIHFVEVTNKENVRILKYLENGKLCNETNLKNGQFFGPQIQYDSLGNKLTEKFVLGVDQIPYKYLLNSATDDKFIDAITCHEINYYSNGIMESKGYIVNSLKSGLWTFYHPDGTIKEIIFFKPKALQ